MIFEINLALPEAWSESLSILQALNYLLHDELSSLPWPHLYVQILPVYLFEGFDSIFL